MSAVLYSTHDANEKKQAFKTEMDNAHRPSLQKELYQSIQSSGEATTKMDNEQLPGFMDKTVKVPHEIARREFPFNPRGSQASDALQNMTTSPYM